MKRLFGILLFFVPFLSFGQSPVLDVSSYSVTPSVIEFVNGRCELTITLAIPPKSFSKSAVYKIVPSFRWQGGVVNGDSIVLQGEKVNSYGRIVSYKNGMNLVMKLPLEYKRGIETGKCFVEVGTGKPGKLDNVQALELPVKVDRSSFLVYETAKDASFYYFRGINTGNSKADAFIRQSERAASADDRISLLNQARALVPNNFMIYNNLALNHLDRGEIDLARSAFNRSFELSGSNEVAANLCLLTFSQRRLEEAAAYLSKCEGATYYNEAKGNFLVSEGKYGNATGILSGSTSNTSILAHILNQEFLVAGRLLEKKERKNAMTYYLQAMLGARSDNRLMLESGLRQLRKVDGRLYRSAKTSEDFAKYPDLFKKIEQ